MITVVTENQALISTATASGYGSTATSIGVLVG